MVVVRWAYRLVGRLHDGCWMARFTERVFWVWFEGPTPSPLGEGYRGGLLMVDLTSAAETQPARDAEGWRREYFVAHATRAHRLFDRGMLTTFEYVEMLFEVEANAAAYSADMQELHG